MREELSLLSSLKKIIFSLLDFPAKGRMMTSSGDKVLKFYSDRREARREYKNLEFIHKCSKSGDLGFSVPKPLLIKESDEINRPVLIETKLSGKNLRIYLMPYILTGRKKIVVNIFRKIGYGLKKFHNSPVNGVKKKKLPTSTEKIIISLEDLVRRLSRRGIIKRYTFDKIRSINIPNFDLKLNQEVLNHGEFYFTHLLYKNGKLGLVDFTEVGKGPRYFDLSSFTCSIYRTFLPMNLNTRDLLAKEFLKGYFGELDEDTLVSIRLTQLYVLLFYTESFLRRLEYSKRSRIAVSIRIYRLLKIINKLLIPHLQKHS